MRLKIKNLIINFGLLLIIIETLTPIYFMIKYSISDRDSIITGGDVIPLWPYHPTFMVYKYLLSSPKFIDVFLNSVKVAGFTLLFALMLGVPMAYGLSKIKSVYRDFLLVFLMSIRVFPDIVSVIPITEFFIKLNLDNTILGVSLAHTLLALPYVIFILLADFEKVPPEIELQAYNLGASKTTTFLKIIMPMVIPSIIVSSIYIFILSWDEFIFSYFILGYGEIETLPVYLNKMLSFQPPQNILMGVAVLLSLPVFVFVLLIQKRLLINIKEGALKE